MARIEDLGKWPGKGCWRRRVRRWSAVREDSICQDAGQHCQSPAENPRQHRAARPGQSWNWPRLDCGGDCLGFLSRSKDRRVRALRDFQDDRFVAAVFIEVLVAFQAQRSYMPPNRAVFSRAVIGWLTKQTLANG